MHTNNKINQQIAYFMACPGMEVDRLAIAETTQKIYNEYCNVIYRNWVFQR